MDERVYVCNECVGKQRGKSGKTGVESLDIWRENERKQT